MALTPETEQDSPAFILAAESGINNGLAAALVLLVLGMMGLSDSDSGGSGFDLARWPCGPPPAALVAGSLIGTGMARWIKLLDPERQADFLEEAMVFATAALAYGAAMAIRTDGFLAVFAAGVALSHGGRLAAAFAQPSTDAARSENFRSRSSATAWLVVVVLLGTLVASIEYKWWMLVFAAVADT